MILLELTAEEQAEVSTALLQRGAELERATRRRSMAGEGKINVRRDMRRQAAEVYALADRIRRTPTGTSPLDAAREYVSYKDIAFDDNPIGDARFRAQVAGHRDPIAGVYDTSNPLWPGGRRND